MLPARGYRPSLDLLGLPKGAPAPPCAAIQVAPADVLPSLGGGLVLSGESFEDDDDLLTLEPEAHGLFDELTFGHLPRNPLGGVDLSAYGEPSMVRRPQVRRAGEIPLHATLLHPWIRRYALDRAAEAAGIDRRTAEGLLDGSLAVDRRGEILRVRTRLNERPRGYHVGAEALDHLANRAGRELDGLLDRLPVLAAGLRAPKRMGKRLAHHHVTHLYARVVKAVIELGEDIEDEGAVLGSRATAVASLQRIVDAVVLDGLDRQLEPATTDEPLVTPLATGFTGEVGARCFQELAAANDVPALILALRGPLFVFRSYLEAAGFEILPLAADGSVDEATRRASFVERTARVCAEVYREHLGELWRDLEIHGPEGTPHVDVYSFDGEEPEDPARIVTAGASSEPQPIREEGWEHVELVCEVPPGTDAAAREGVMEALLALARYPFRRSTFLGPGHDVGIGHPLLPGSPLTAWVLYEAEDEWAERLSSTLPRHPRFLHAVAVTQEEQAFKMARGSDALRARRGGKLVTLV